MRRTPTRGWLAAAGLLCLACPVEALADDFTVTPSISLRQEYNDNILFSADGELDDFITTLTPALRLRERTERFDLKIESELDAVGYWEYDKLNAFDTRQNASAAYRLTPLLSLSAAARYEKDSRSDRDLETTGQALRHSKREKQYYSGGFQWTPSETVQTAITGFYGRNDYDYRRYVDSEYGGFSAAAAMDLAGYLPKATGKANFAYVRYDYTTTITKDYLFTVGLDYDISERLTVSGELGPRFTRSDYYGRSGENWGVGGKLGADFQVDELTGLSFFISQETADRSGGGGTVDRTTVDFSIRRKIHGELSMALDARYRRNKSQDDISIYDTDEDYYSLSPRLTYKLTDDLSVQTVYRYTTLKEDVSGAGTRVTRRNLVFAELTCRVPLFD